MALAFGRWDVDAFELEIGSAQLAEWLAYEKRTGPLGAQRQDILMAGLESVIAASVGAKVPVGQFMPSWRPTPQVDEAAVWDAYMAGEYGDVA